MEGRGDLTVLHKKIFFLREVARQSSRQASLGAENGTERVKTGLDAGEKSMK